MSLFTGNVVDENGVAIDCKFKFYFDKINVLSNERNTELNQWSVDSDDADISNQSAAFSSGDVAIIHYYTATACAIVRVIGDGSDSYVFDVELRECVAPTVTLHSIAGIVVGSAYVAGSSSSDEFQWEYGGVTHYHKESWYGQTWCTEVGIQTVEYDFGAGFSTTNSHTYSTSGTNTVTVRVTNKCGLTAEDVATFDVKYPEPTISLDNAPVVPSVGETTVVSSTIVDTYSRVTDIVYKLDGTVITDLSLVFNAVNTHVVTADMYWNDGFSDLVVSDTLTINMQAASIQLTLSNELVNEERQFTSTVVKGDGDYNGITYNVSYTLPVSNQVVEIYEVFGSEVQVLDLVLPGTYIVKATVTDEYGMTANDSNTVIVECVGSDIVACETWCLTQDTIDYIMNKTYLPDTDDYNIEDHIRAMYMVVKGECTKVTMTNQEETLVIKDEVDIITIRDRVDKIVVTDISDPLN